VKRSLVVLALVVVAPFACNKKEAGEKPGTGEQATEATPEASTQQKLQPYIECLNRHSRRIGDIRDRYLEGVDPERGPSPDKGAVMSEMNEIDDCVAAMQKAKTMAPPIPELEKAGDDYAAALTQLAPVVKQAYDYYQPGNWKDDKAAKGIELHPKLMAAFQAFATADKALSDQVKTLNRKAREDDLARREKAGGVDLMTVTDRLTLEAETLVQLCEVDATKLETIDVAALTAQIEKVEKQLADVENFAAAHKDQVNQHTGFTSVPGGARQFLKASKELMRRARDKQPFTGSDLTALGTNDEWTVLGSPAQIFRYYDQMVDAYNRM